MEDEYIVHATDRGYWGTDRRGYYLNPIMAGIYTKAEASSICGDKSRKEKMYPNNCAWHKKKTKEYEINKMYKIQGAMEGLKTEQLIKMIPDMIFKRMELNG